MKKLIATAATALGMAAAAEDVVIKQAPEPAPKPKAKRGRPAKHIMKSGKVAPSKAAIKKMEPEKAAYWNRRLAEDAMLSWWNKKRNVQARAGRVRAEMPVPMTRQVRRAEERRLAKASGRGIQV